MSIGGAYEARSRERRWFEVSLRDSCSVFGFRRILALHWRCVGTAEVLKAATGRVRILTAFVEHSCYAGASAVLLQYQSRGPVQQ